MENVLTQILLTPYELKKFITQFQIRATFSDNVKMIKLKHVNIYIFVNFVKLFKIQINKYNILLS